MELVKTMELDKELLASLREGSIGEAVEQIEAAARARGFAKGRAEAKAAGKAEDILRILDKRGLALTDEQRAQVLECADLEVLDRWFDAALDATSVGEVFV
jgi:hypothetical protein